MFKSMKKVGAAFHLPTRQEREEAYLSRAKDRYDLEYRMRLLDQGKHPF